MPRLIRGHRLSRDAGDRSHDVALGESAIASTSRAPLVANALTKEASVGRALIDEGERSLSIDRGSPSPMHRERSASKRQEASSSAVPPSPPAMASDVSTSGESDLEMDGDTTQAGRGNISIVDEHADGDDDEEMNDGGGGAAALDDGSPEVKCMWEDCGVIFTSLAPFINHLHEEHVGIHKNRYACEWTGCPRKGKGQTSRFALLSHLRSHTGEKPFTCPRPECDKSFTRSDALAKHMRVQHNINPVTSRTKNAAGSATMPGGRGGRRGDGEEEDWIALGLEGEGAGRAGSDMVGDELLELAEGEAGNGSLADIEQSLLMLDSKSPFFTYENLFGAGARALAHHARTSVNGKKGAANDPSKNHVGPIPDAELGIERDTQYSVGLLLNDGVRDDEAIAREENEMARSLEAGRREWVRRERENAELRREAEGSARRETVDYVSDDDAEQADTSVRSSKRIRRSSMRNAPKPIPGVNDVGTLKRLYIVEKAKLRWIRKENEKMRVALADLRQVERQEMMEKRALLERTLEVELGKEVGAIFSPPGSPRG